MDQIIPEEINKEKIVSQQNLKSDIDKLQNSSIKNFISIMTEEETSLWFKKLNLEEEVLENIEKIIKNGKDLISIYNDNKMLEKLNINLHSQNIINEAIEEGLEEQLKINIALEKDKSIILNIENEPKYKLKEVLSYLEKLLKRTVYLTPNNSENEILTPNTLIVKKILLNPDKYSNLKIFDEKTLGLSPPEKSPIVYPKSENVNVNINLKKNKNEPPSSLPLNDPLLNDNNKNSNVTNNTKMSNMTKGYVSLFQNKKNNLPDFNTDYKMPSQNRNNTGNNNNYIKLDTKEDFKYHNILSMKNKDEKEDKTNNIINDMRYTNDSNLEQKNIGFKNITNIGNSDNDNKLNKNYFTQRNFNSKNLSNINDNNNNMMFQNILNNKKRNDNYSGMMGKAIENIGGGGDDTTSPNTNSNTNTNLSFLERNKKEKDNSFNINFINKDSNNAINKNKTESRYEYNRFQDLDKDNLFKNNNNMNNVFNMPKTNEDNNEINIDNLIINSNNNKTEELKNSKDKNDYKYGGINNLIPKPEKDESESNILKLLREKYSFQNNDSSKDLDSNNRINFDFKKEFKEYKPKTPITDGRRTFGTENINLKFNNNITDDNNNNPLENKFLMKQNNEEYIKLNNFLNKNEDDSNIISKFKYDMNMDNNNNKIGKNRNRPSAGLEFNSFQYKAAGYKSSFPQNQEKELNQLSQLNQYEENEE